MSTVRIALANIRCATPPDESVALAREAIRQPYGREGLLVADLDTDAATGLLAARLRSP